jgi:hypothetical protein
MVCLPTITAPTGSWARCSETSRANVRQTHRATVRSDERARPPRRAPGRSSTYPRRHRVVVCVQSPGIHEIRFENPATPAKGTTCFRSFSIGNDLFTTVFTAQMGRGKIQCGAFSSRRLSTVQYCPRAYLPLIRKPFHPNMPGIWVREKMACGASGSATRRGRALRGLVAARGSGG